MRVPARFGGRRARTGESESGGPAPSVEPGAGAEPLRHRLLRERLYQPSVSETDLAAYREALEESGVGLVAAPPAPQRVGRWTGTRCFAVVGGLVVVLLLGAVGAVGVVRAPSSRPTTAASPSLVVTSLIDPKRERDVRAALIAHQERPDDVLTDLATGVSPALSSSASFSANSAAVSGVASGRTTVPLGPLGTTAGGHAITVVVATLHGRYDWELTAGGREQARTTLASASASGAGAASSAAAAVPRGLHDLQIVFEVPTATRFAYSVVLGN